MYILAYSSPCPLVPMLRKAPSPAGLYLRTTHISCQHRRLPSPHLAPKMSHLMGPGPIVPHRLGELKELHTLSRSWVCVHLSLLAMVHGDVWKRSHSS